MRGASSNFPCDAAVPIAMVIRLYSAAKYPRRLETEMDQSMIDPIASTTPSIVVTVGIGGSGGGVVAMPKVWRPIIVTHLPARRGGGAVIVPLSRRQQPHDRQDGKTATTVQRALPRCAATPWAQCQMPRPQARRYYVAAVGELARSTSGQWIARPPLRCPRGHPLRPDARRKHRVLVWSASDVAP